MRAYPLTVIEASKGGSTNLQNFVAACAKCNQTRARGSSRPRLNACVNQDPFSMLPGGDRLQSI